MKTFFTALVLFTAVAALAYTIAEFIQATDCPPGKVAVRDAWGWPVCVIGGSAP